MTAITYPADVREHTLTAVSAGGPSVALGWRKPPPWSPVTHQQHVLIGLRLRRHERRIAKELSTLVDSPHQHTVRWQRVYTASQRESGLTEVDTWFRIDCAVSDLEGLRQASAVAPRVKSTHWVIADGVTRVLVGWDLTPTSEAATAGAGHRLVRRLFGRRWQSGAQPHLPVEHRI